MLVYQVQADETVSKSRRIRRFERVFVYKVQKDETVSKLGE